MKKIFYILASAIVALGAVACENEGMENIAPEVNGDTVSFVANIDNTKTDLDGLQTIWTAGDEITVVWNEKEYTFTNSDKNVNEFSCTAEGLSAIVDAEVEAWYNKAGVDSSKGTAGAQLYAEGSFGELSFQIQSAFLKFTTTEEVVLAGEGLFNNAKASYTGTDVYVAINAVESTLSYSIGGVQCKSLTKNFDAGKIYNLGTLTAPSATIKGSFDGWGNGVNMYKEGDYHVAKNVTFASDCAIKFVTTSWIGGPTSTYGSNIDVLCKAANNGGGSNIDVAKGTYDIYLKTDETEFYIVEAGKTFTGNNTWRLYGDSTISGIGTSWSTSSYIPMWKGVDGQYYITITFGTTPYFKLYNGSNYRSSNWTANNDGTYIDQEVTTSGNKTYWGDSGKAFYINAQNTSKTVGFNGDYIWLTE